MSTSDNIYFNGNITKHEITEDRLLLEMDDGHHYAIPLSMLGYFLEPYAPSIDTELLLIKSDPQAVKVEVTKEQLHVHLEDGRVISAPLGWFPRLKHGTTKEHQNVSILNGGLHWEDLDEDISITELFKMTGPSAESEASIRRWLEARPQKKSQKPLVKA